MSMTAPRSGLSRRHVFATTLSVFAGAISLGLPTVDSAQAASRPLDAVWIGAAADGRWPTKSFSHPSRHHTFRYSNPGPGDWGFDEVGVTEGQSVYLYAAPRDTRLNNAISAIVQSVAPICGRRAGESRASQLARGGYAVTVAIYSRSTKVGTVTYGHVQPKVRQGQRISRWGARIGTIGKYRGNGCWDGVHLHMELYNQTRYACYNGAYTRGHRMRRGNYIGYLGGAFASGPRQACPRGI